MNDYFMSREHTFSPQPPYPNLPNVVQDIPPKEQRPVEFTTSQSTINNQSQCQLCKTTFSRPYEIGRHILEQHQCWAPNCNNQFSTSKDRDKHEKLHPEKYGFRCGTCELNETERVFRRKDKLEKHLRGTHHTSNRIECTMAPCSQMKLGGKLFASVADLEQHMKSKHPQASEEHLPNQLNGQYSP